MTCTHPTNNEARAKELGNEIFDRKKHGDAERRRYKYENRNSPYRNPADTLRNHLLKI